MINTKDPVTRKDGSTITYKEWLGEQEGTAFTESLWADFAIWTAAEIMLDLEDQ